MFIRRLLAFLINKSLSPILAPLQQVAKQIERLREDYNELIKRFDLIQQSLGRIETRQLIHPTSDKLQNYEFRVFSQWGEDGIIQFLISKIEIQKKIFVEFGVEDYKQANTRFLLVNNNWSGLVIDASEENVSKIKLDPVYWNYNLKAINSFVTKDNINGLLLENGLSGEIGLLSIDIDGNDYWIWDSINIIQPIIVVIEYNHRFGYNAAVTIPYDTNFERSRAHFSMIYFGASLKALYSLGKQKGYTFIGCCSNGVNAFFVRSDKLPPCLKGSVPENDYFPGQFCETRNESGIQVKTSPEDEVELLTSLKLPLVNIEGVD